MPEERGLSRARPEEQEYSSPNNSEPEEEISGSPLPSQSGPGGMKISSQMSLLEFRRNAEIAILGNYIYGAKEIGGKNQNCRTLRCREFPFYPAKVSTDVILLEFLKAEDYKALIPLCWFDNQVC